MRAKKDVDGRRRFLYKHTQSTQGRNGMDAFEIVFLFGGTAWLAFCFLMGA
jgi:hypothetical protein